MTFDTTDLTPRIGTEIRIDRSRLLAAAATCRAQLRDLLERRGVLLFRALNLSDDEQLRLAAILGDVIPQGDRGIYKVTLDPKLNATADYLHATHYWHIDGAQDEVPTRASLLSARRLSPAGGQTEFANTYAAYDDLPENDKHAYNRLRVFHSQETIQRRLHPQPTEAQLARWHLHPTRLHPLVWTHRSGRKSLVLGLTASHVDGMSREAGRALLDRLQAWATQPQFVYRHEWTVGDLIIWDNTGVLHRAEPYAADSGRLMSRTTLLGEEPLA